MLAQSLDCKLLVQNEVSHEVKKKQDLLSQIMVSPHAHTIDIGKYHHIVHCYFAQAATNSFLVDPI